MRYKACKEAGMKEVSIIIADNLTEEQQREFLIKDNTSGGEWDWEVLSNEWDSEQLEDWGLDIPEVEVDEVLEAEEDDFDTTPPEIPITVLGDLYEIGEHRLLCGDSTDVDSVLKLIDKNKKFSIYTDPPYGINLDGDNSNRGTNTSLMKGGLNLKSFKDDTIQYAVDAFNITREFNPLKEVWWGANYYCHHLPQTNNWLVWDKRVEEKMRNTNSDCELAWVADGHNSVRIFRHLWNGLIKASEKGEKRVHPTQKPIELASYCFNEYEMGNIILDLFGGSGASMVACEQTKRNCLMMEFEPHYCDVIVKRMIKLDDTLTVKRNGIDCTNEFKD
jgi:DNA modification methylase